MASTFGSLKKRLAQPIVEGEGFAILADLASLMATEGKTPQSRDLMIRALDRMPDLQSELPLLVSLARDHGLFPW